MRHRLAVLIIGLLALSNSALLLAEIDPAKPTMFITGSNRGIGLEFVDQYSAKGWNVIATTRKPAESDDLNDLAKERSNIIVEQLDVTDFARIEALAEKYKDTPIDLIINNAAITPKYMSAYRSLDGVDFDMARRSFEVNALAPLKIAQAFMPLVEKSKQKKIVTISSKAGSFSESPESSMMYSYRASKAALNMLLYTLHFETADNDVIVTLISPGRVNTMGILGKVMPGTISTDESVGNMMKVIDQLDANDNGKFLNHEDGSVVGW